MRFDRFVVLASNVHQGGGRILLDALLRAASPGTVAVIDERMPLSCEHHELEIHRVRPSPGGRFHAERWLAAHVRSSDAVLCFGNLPPLFKLKGHTSVFLQNRYLVEDQSLVEFPVKIRMRIRLERMWLARKSSNVDEFIVQTPSMKRLLLARIHDGAPIRVLPFVSDPSGYATDSVNPDSIVASKFNFIYASSGEPHKNHECLIRAWCALAEEGLYPTLIITIDCNRFPALCARLDESRRKFGIAVRNVGEQPHEEILRFYKSSSAAIFPSKFESFGIPLVEARQAGLPVIASELDYVRDVVDPEQSFDPDSPASIARAVKRFMGYAEHARSLLDAKQFIDSIVTSRVS